MSQHLKVLQKPSVILFLSLTVLAYSLFLPFAINKLSPFPLQTKILIVFFLLMPAGISGVPFRSGFHFSARSGQTSFHGLLRKRRFSVLSDSGVMLAITAGSKSSSSRE
jgi:hypothetical protein